MIPLAFAIENCDKITEPNNIPCRIVSAWAYSPPCSNYISYIYNSTGGSVANYTFENHGISGLCSFNFNISTAGSYNFIVSNGDNGEIIVRYVNMLLGITVGIGIIIAIFMFLAFKLDESHGLLKLLLIFFSVALISIIPAVYIIDNFATVFYKVIMGFVTVFWLYVAGYFFYWIYKKLIGMISTK